MQAILDEIRTTCGEQAVIDAEQADGRPINGYGETMGAVPVLRPQSAEELSMMLQRCHAAGQTVIPLGGGSGLVGGTKAFTGDEWYVSLERMREIESVDALSRVAVVQAGVPLAQLHDAAKDVGLAFQVDLGARGSAQIGGLISTNAGGERVLRFGMMREQVLGLEVVLADGTILDLMDSVIKNNTGYDLRQIFIGSEGTLGIVTRAVLRLRPALPVCQTAFVSVDSFEQVTELLRRVELGLGGGLSAFEVMWPDFYHTVLDHKPGTHRAPVPRDGNRFVLLEAELGERADDQLLYEILNELFEEGKVGEVAVAQSSAERESLWAIRNDIDALFGSLQPMISFDVSLPIQEMEGYVDEVRAALTARFPDVRMLAFGHLADNNIHLVVNVGEDTKTVHSAEIGAMVHGPVIAKRGAISAEHGVGLEKRDYLHQSRTPEVIATMRALKQAMDPQGILNPGKVLNPVN